MTKGTYFHVLCIVFLLISCSKNKETVLDTKIIVENKVDKQVFQSTDKMKSNYRENSGDGYSWRYRDITYDKKNETVSQEKLLSTIWKMDPSKNQYAVLVFYSDNVFKIGTYQGGVSIQGNYNVKESKIILTNYAINEFMRQIINMDSSEIECEINFNSENVEFSNELLIGNTKFFPIGSEKNNGEKAIIQNQTVIVDKNTYVFNDTVRFRTSPTITSDVIEIFLYNQISNRKINTTSFKKGTIITTLARTNFTEKIDGLTAPWYYIVVYDGFEGYQFGWVFGAYFDPYIEEKDSLYWDIVRKEIGVFVDNENTHKNELSFEQQTQLTKNKKIAESLYKLKTEIELNADRTVEKKNYYTIYFSNENSAYDTVIEFVNNDYLMNSQLKVGIETNELIEILGEPTRKSENEIIYDIFKPAEGYGYRLIFSIINQKIKKIKCYFEK